jgi:hypothetical protein
MDDDRQIQIIHVEHRGTNWGRVLLWVAIVFFGLWLLLIYLASQTLMGQS